MGACDLNSKHDSSFKFLLWSPVQYKKSILKGNCLGPIARPQLGTCLHHSKATACLCSHLIIACIVHTSSHSMIGNKDTSWSEPTTHNDLFICTPRHGGSTEPALPAARRKLRPVREKGKRNSQGIHLCSQLNLCPKGRTNYIRVFMHKSGSYKGSGKSVIKQRTEDTRNQTTLLSGSMLEVLDMGHR